MSFFLLFGFMYAGGLVMYSHTRDAHNEEWNKETSEAMSSHDGENNRHYEKTFSVQEGGDFVLVADAGEVDIDTWEKNEVNVIVDLSGTDSRIEKYQVEFNQEGNKVYVTGKVNDHSFFKWNVGRLDAKYTILLPKNFNTDVQSSGGDISVKNLHGTVHGKTNGGNVTINSLVGNVTIETSGGEINFRDITGNVDAYTSGGNVHTENISGDMFGESSGGDMEYIDISGRVKAKTSGGDVTLKIPGENKGIDAETSGGDITLYLKENISATIDAETTGGIVDCDFPVTVKGKVERNELHGKINGGGNPIRIETTGGDIRIAILKK